jgi:hypothetical protein
VKASFIVLAVLALACGSEEFDVPSGYAGSLPDDPRACGDVRANGSVDGAEVIIDGQPAACVGDSVVCGVDDVPAFADACLTGVANAVCVTQKWAIRCDLDAGTSLPDGGDGG